MGNKALEITNLSAKVGSFSLRDINFSIEKGTIMGLIGKNAAGKTTLIKTIFDRIDRKSGEVLFDGIPLRGNEKIVKSKIGIVYDKLMYPLNAKPIKMKSIIAPFYENYDHKKFDILMRKFDLDPYKKLSAYSKGMQMKFNIVMAVCHDPELIILDEPTAGLDPVARADVMELLLELMQKEERAVLFSTHITSDLEKIGDYITSIDNGRIIFSEEKEELISKFSVVNVDKEAMTNEIKEKILGAKETTFGYQGLCLSEHKLENISGIKTARPTIEDIMIYRGGRDVK
ncbi:ABC transporter ATP-binding protein [Clostridium grantii]|uniref:ABC-2 type transport system ATP-binding protein n=1 Tax=Clostridium grantii DSM 8605 TaxID=1121316 RepID=A0A1M5UU25_9CLOT|nr:ABC transporter ATP-binding protein [Clostridium grantii]SHH66328.1 ABC-2 type transport system ATP-binding protein [Clostridium grantii DSM 8605]